MPPRPTPPRSVIDSIPRLLCAIWASMLIGLLVMAGHAFAASHKLKSHNGSSLKRSRSGIHFSVKKKQKRPAPK
jgi:hypothetical protein